MSLDQFDKWFLLATAGLAVAEKQHLEPELRSHFEDAVADGLGRGLDSQQAITKAIRSLGNPNVCNANYRTLYFTEWEYKILFTPRRIDSRLNSLVVVLAVVGMIVSLLIVSKNSPDFIPWGFLVAQLLSSITPLVLTRLSPRLFWIQSAESWKKPEEAIDAYGLSHAELGVLGWEQALNILGLVLVVVSVLPYGLTLGWDNGLVFLLMSAVLCSTIVYLSWRLYKFQRFGSRSARA
jgi:hypothetical protein